MPVKQAQLVQEQCEYAVVDLSDNTTTVYTGPCMLLGTHVNTVLSAHIVLITDGATTVASMPASTAAGTDNDYHSIRLETSLIVNPDNSSTGSLLVMYRPVNPSFVDGLTVITPAS